MLGRTRVAARSEGRSRADETGRELVEVRLAHDDRASVDECLHRRRAGRRSARERGMAGSGLVTLGVDVVLHRDGPTRDGLGAGEAARSRAHGAGIGARDPRAERARAIRRGERGVDAGQVSGHRIATNAWPGTTSWPLATMMRTTRPAIGAFTVVSIFMLSSTTSGSPAATC